MGIEEGCWKRFKLERRGERRDDVIESKMWKFSDDEGERYRGILEIGLLVLFVLFVWSRVEGSFHQTVKHS